MAEHGAQDGFGPEQGLKGTIFIVTYARSGSTLLQSLLQSIPGAHIRGENRAVLHKLYQASLDLRHARREHGWHAPPPDHPWYGISETLPEAFERQLAQAFVDTVLRPPRGARWIGFKEVRYPALKDRLPDFLDFCCRAFVNPVFVFNSRDATEVSRSGWWARQPAAEVLEMVAASDRLFAACAARFGDRAVHLHYEDLLAGPSCLAPLFDRLGEAFEPDRLARILDKRLTH